MIKFCCYLAFLSCCVPFFARGEILELSVYESLDVYKKPNGRKRISQLDRGDRVVISPRIYGNYRKVLITYKGKKRSGYIAIKDIVRSTIASQSEKFLDYRVYKNRKSMGINTTLFFSQIGEQNIQTVNENTYEVGKLKMFASYLALYGQYPWGSRKAVDISLSFFRSEGEGNVYLQNSDISEEIEVTQRQMRLRGLLKFYHHSNASFWYGPLLDLAWRRSSQFKVKSIDIKAKDEKDKFFIVIGGGIGWDIQLSRSIYLIPEIKLGFSLMKKPSIINGEFSFKTAWAF